MDIRSIAPADRAPLAGLLDRIENFSPEEVRCALEVIDLALQPSNPDYLVLVALMNDVLVGYVAYGPTPMTEGTFDLYWIGSEPALRGKGIGAGLIATMEADLRRRKARMVRVETSATEDYGPARGFYQSMRYLEESRFRDFYKPGDDLILLKKKL